MIKNTPSSDDFLNAGKAQFDFAWDIVVSFLKLFDEASEYDIDAKANEKEFWKAAKQRILTALAITQQGVELILKSKIVSISPYLLIAGTPSDWPKAAHDNMLDFSDFRTIDAQDLIKTHDTFSNTKLNSKFIEQFDSLRKLRNRIMHTVDKNLQISALEVVTKILDMHEFLIENENWVKTRTEFLEESPASMLYSPDGIEAQVSWEFFILFSLLKPAQVKKYFGVDKKQRNYICPECAYNNSDYNMIKPTYALLNPNTPISKNLYCFVCHNNHPIIRENCNIDGCKGNVISDEFQVCCTCGS